MSLGANVKRIREAKGKKLNEVASLSNVSAGYLSAIEREEKKNPSRKFLEKIANVLEVPIGLFFSDKDTIDNIANNAHDSISFYTKPVELNNSILYELNETVSDSDKKEALKEIIKNNPELFYDLSISDRTKILNQSYVELDKIPIYSGELIEKSIIDYTYIPKNKNLDSSIFGIKSKDDSMNHIGIHEGDTVIVRSQSFLNNGDIGVIVDANQIIKVRKVFIVEDKITLVPQSSNPEYEPKILNLNDIKIIGKVIEFRRKI